MLPRQAPYHLDLMISRLEFTERTVSEIHKCDWWWDEKAGKTMQGSSRLLAL
ncbi:hypothetical protein CGRA01v4_02976 [Colletotrichum graminicola]|nr:hypothetical protein CGRA01v4_02976 [Colletotrichum graminicola]